LEAVRKQPAIRPRMPGSACVKNHVHARLLRLPPLPEFNKSTISDIRSSEVESMIQLSGTVVKTGVVRMLEVSKEYQCTNPRCRYRFTVKADPEQDNLMPHPRICPSAKVTLPPSAAANGGPSSPRDFKCSSTNLVEVEGSRVCVDYQEIKIQDQAERVELGCSPRAIVVILQADLVDLLNAGDEVTVVGWLVRLWKPLFPGTRCSLEHVSMNRRYGYGV
jgi:DNA helicase MCM9